MVRKATDPSSYADCINTALRILQRAAQTEQKMREKLTSRQYDLAVIDNVIKKLKEMQFIDDQKYAHDYVAYRSRTSPLGRFNLTYKLIQKGVQKDLAKNATNEISSEQELELAVGLANKRLSKLRRLEPEQQKIKIARFLASRGFSADVVYKVIKEL